MVFVVVHHIWDRCVDVLVITILIIIIRFDLFLLLILRFCFLVFIFLFFSSTDIAHSGCKRCHHHLPPGGVFSLLTSS